MINLNGIYAGNAGYKESLKNLNSAYSTPFTKKKNYQADLDSSLLCFVDFPIN
jgi:hypothetical protein